MAIYGTNTDGAPVSLSPDVNAVLPEIYLQTTLLSSTATIVAAQVNGDRPVVRVPIVGEVPNIGFVAEGSEIPGVDPELSEIVVQTNKLASLHTISNEAYHAGTAADLVTSSLSQGVVAQADRSFIANPATAGESTGIANTPGIVDGGEIGSNLDGIIDALALIEAEGGQTEDAVIVAHPTAWATLSKMKTGAGSNVALVEQITAATNLGEGASVAAEQGAPSVRPQRFVAGTPLFLSRFLPANALFVWDKRNIIAAASELEITSSDQSVAFRYDSVDFRVTYRIGWSVRVPGRVTKLDIPEA